MADASIEDRFKAMPPITRAWFVAGLLTTIGVELGFVAPQQLYLDWGLIVNQFQIWRLVTCFHFFGGFGMKMAFNLFILCRVCYGYEDNPFTVGTHISGGRSSADFAMLMIFGALVQSIIGYLMGLPFLGSTLVFAVLYVWSRKNAEQNMSMFGMPFKGIHYPWVMLGLSVLLGSSPVPFLIGIATGHLFYFWIDVVPNHYADSFPRSLILQTPQFLFDFFDEDLRVPGRGGDFRPAPRSFGAFSGQGQTLGGR